MIRRNTASQVITLPFLGLAADSSAVTTGATLTVLKDGTSGASAGTLTHFSGGVWKYTPTQGETDAAIVGLILTATNAIPVVLNLVTTGADTSATALGANTTAPPTASAVADEVQTRTIARVTLVDTCTVNSDMRGTDSALTTLGSNAPVGWLDAAAFSSGAFDAVWTVTTRGLTEEVALDSESIAAIQNGVVLANSAHGGSGATLTLGAVTITVTGSAPNITLAGSGSGNGIEWARSGSGDPLDQDIVDQIQDGIGGGGGGDATLAKQEQILTAIQGSTVIQVASPNVQGNLVLTQGDDYDGIANPRASWTVSTDYTDGWSVTLTIRDADDAVIYTTSGEVVSSTVVAVTIAAPTGLTMTGCPGQWQGKFDVELTKSGSKKTIALGVCYINEDQTR